MSEHPRKVKLVQEVPDCKPLTREAHELIASEAKAWHKAFSEKVAAMEKLSAEDFKIRAR